MPSKIERPVAVAALMLAGCGQGYGELPPPPAAIAPAGDTGPIDSGHYPTASGGQLAPEAPTTAAQRYDAVGYATAANLPGIGAAHRSLPVGSFVEVTAIDNGQTALVPIVAVAQGDGEIELSDAAAAQLGLGAPPAPVRVRTVKPSGPDLALLRVGQPAPLRAPTPPVLLTALRAKLGDMPRAKPAKAPQPPRSASVRRPPLAPPPGSVPSAPERPTPAQPTQRAAAGGYFVQVAALSDAARAQALARQLGGRVASSGGLHRVRTGPYATERAAQAARDGIARRGYGDARIVRQD